MSAVAKVIGYVLLAGGLALIAMGLIGIYMDRGFTGLQEVLSPFNVWQWAATLITLAPGLFFLWLADWLGKHRKP